MPIYWRDKRWIRDWAKEWFTAKQIQSKFKKKTIDLWAISEIMSTYNKLKWSTLDWQLHLRCNSCYNTKPYTYKYFQITEKSKTKKCRHCRNLIRRNKRKLKKNLWQTITNQILNKRRWWRRKIMRLIDIDYYKSWYKPGYLKVEKDVNYFRRINIKKIWT